MPVDLSVGNSVVEAFMKGRMIAEARQRRQFEQEQALKENELKQKRLDEDTRQFNEQLTHNKNLFAANQKAAAAKHDLDLTEIRAALATKMGMGVPVGVESQVVPQGDSREAFFNMNAAEGANFENPAIPISTRMSDFGGEIGKVSAPDPITLALQQTQMKDIGAEAEIKNKLKFEQGKRDILLPGEIAQIQAKSAVDYALEGEKHKNRIVEIRERTKGTKEGILLRNSGLMDREEKRLQTSKNKITPAQRAKIDALAHMRLQAIEVMKLGDESKWSAHVPFVGNIVAGAKASTGKGTPSEATYRSKMGGMTAKQMHDLYGSVLSKGEIDRSISFIPTFSVSGKTAKSNIQSMVQDLTQQIELATGESADDYTNRRLPAHSSNEGLSAQEEADAFRRKKLGGK